MLYACETEEATSIPQEDTITEITPPTDPTIIREYHQFSSDGTISRISYFDEQGNLSKYWNTIEDFETHFVINTDLQITQIVTRDLLGNDIEVLQNMIYDLNGKITQINDRTFFYNTTENAYYENSDVMEDGVLLHTESDTTYNKFYYDEGNPMLQFCYMITEVEGDIFNEYCLNSNSWYTGYANNNVTSFHPYPSYYRYYYDDTVSPLFSNTNLIDIIALIPSLRSEDFRFLKFLSKNNLTSIDDPDGPLEETQFAYDFNEYDLPTHTYSSYFYSGEQQGETRLIATYYYQE